MKQIKIPEEILMRMYKVNRGIIKHRFLGVCPEPNDVKMRDLCINPKNSCIACQTMDEFEEFVKSLKKRVKC